MKLFAAIVRMAPASAALCVARMGKKTMLRAHYGNPYITAAR